MNRFFGVILSLVSAILALCEQKAHLGERLDFSSMASGSFPRQEAEGTMSGSLILMVLQIDRSKDQPSGLHEIVSAAPAAVFEGRNALPCGDCEDRCISICIRDD